MAVCDLQEKLLDWFRRMPTVQLFTTDYKELLRSPEVDVVYVAVPHNLHEKLYLDVLAAGKDLFAEKPFGIDLEAARAIRDAAAKSGRFVRCSSEFPFLPPAQRVVQAVQSGKLGRILEIRSGFWHASDLDPTKPVNWKRQAKTCGEIGVMGDLGMHAVHVPFRLGWKPKRVYAQLQKIYTQRPDGKGGMAPCDTWDNAMLHTEVKIGGDEVPMRLEMKRLAPGETNTWFIEVLGTEGGVRFSTKEPKTLWVFERAKEQIWQRIDLGHQMAFTDDHRRNFRSRLSRLLPADVGRLRRGARGQTRQSLRLRHARRSGPQPRTLRGGARVAGETCRGGDLVACSRRRKESLIKSPHRAVVGTNNASLRSL